MANKPYYIFEPYSSHFNAQQSIWQIHYMATVSYDSYLNSNVSKTANGQHCYNLGMATISSGKNLEWSLAILVVSPRGYCDSDESNIRLDCVAYFE